MTFKEIEHGANTIAQERIIVTSGSCPGREGLDVVFKDWKVVEEPKPRKYKKPGVGDIINTTILLISSLSQANARLNFTAPSAIEQGHMTSDGQQVLTTVMSITCELMEQSGGI